MKQTKLQIEQMELLTLASHVAANLGSSDKEIQKEILSIHNEIKGLVYLVTQGTFQIVAEAGINNLTNHIDEVVIALGTRDTERPIK